MLIFIWLQVNEVTTNWGIARACAKVHVFAHLCPSLWVSVWFSLPKLPAIKPKICRELSKDVPKALLFGRCLGTLSVGFPTGNAPKMGTFTALNSARNRARTPPDLCNAPLQFYPFACHRFKGGWERRAADCCRNSFPKKGRTRGVAGIWFAKSWFWQHLVGFLFTKSSKSQSSLHSLESGPPEMGNGWNIVARVLFRKRGVSYSLSSAPNSVSSLWPTNNKLNRTH